MKYYEESMGFTEDGLLSGKSISTIIYNVKVTTSVVRGQIICRGEDGWSPATENDDAQKPLAIVAATFTPDDTHKVTQAYVRQWSSSVD